MSQETTEAIVLRGVDYGETSRIVTFLSPDRGRFACMAQGVRRPKSKLAPVVDTFNRVELVYYWKDGRQVQKLGEATLLDGFGGLKADLDKSVWAAFPLEVAHKTAQVNEPSRALYAALVKGLIGMEAWEGDAKVHALWQVILLLAEAGFALGVEVDASPPSRGVGFRYDAGLVDPGTRRDRTLSATGYEALCRMLEAGRICPGVSDTGDLFEALRGYVTHHFEGDFRSLRVIEQIVG